jgi:hypothetical protein
MRQKTLVRLAPLLLLLTCVMFAPVPGVADSITSDTLTVFNRGGGIVAQVSAFETDEDAGSFIFHLTGNPNLANPAMFGNPTTLCEEGTSPCDLTTPFTSLSDIVGVVPVTIGMHTRFFLGFSSDGENGLAPGVELAFGGFGTKFMVETPGVPIDVTYLLARNRISAGWTATFVSGPALKPVLAYERPRNGVMS